MVRNIDVRTEVRKITSSKPVYAAAGAGVLATQTLRRLPGRLARWSFDGPVTSLQGRATGYVAAVRARAADSYDMLADHGRKVLDGQDNGQPKNALRGKAGSTPGGIKASASRASGSNSNDK